MTIVQQTSVAAGTDSTNPVNFITTFDVPFSAATAGNVLIAVLAADKTIGTPTTPSGWTLVDQEINSNVSLVVYEKVADGGETSITFLWSTAARMAWGYVQERDDVTVTGRAADSSTSGNSNVTSLATATVAAAGDAIAIAAWAVDSCTAYTAGIDGQPSWSNSFSRIAGQNDNSGTIPGANPGFPGASIAERSVGAGSYNTTASWDTSDQASTVLAIFPLAGGTVYNDAGQGTAAATGAGADALVAAEGGQGAATAAAAGADALSVAEAGQGAATGLAGAADTLTANEGGQATSAATAGAADRLAFAEAGGGVGVAAGAGSDALLMGDAGQGTSAAVAGGLDTFSGSTVYTDAGGAVALALAAGADVLAAADAGGALGVLAGGALDAVVMAEAGGGLVAASGGGVDVWVIPSDAPPAGAALTARSPRAVVTSASPAATLASAALPAASISPRSPSGLLTPRSPAGTLTPSA